MGSVSRVRPRVDSACCYHALEEDRVPDAVEGVDADCFAGLESQGAETCCELSDCLVCEAGGDGVGGIKGVDVDLGGWLLVLGWREGGREGFNVFWFFVLLVGRD